MGEEKIYFEPDGRKYKKEQFTKMVPRYTFLRGIFRGKFYSDKTKNDDVKEEFFEFKIYEGEVEILEKSKCEFKHSKESQTSIKINKAQLPEKILYFERREDQNKYFALKVENPDFRNFEFVRELQQNEGDEAFGTVNAEFYGFIVDFLPEHYFKKRYALINLIKEEVVEIPEPPVPPIPPRPTKSSETKIDGKTLITNVTQFYQNYRCRNNFLLSLALTLFSLFIGFTPLFIIGILWLLHTVFKCYFSYLKYLIYLFGLLFLIGLAYSIINTNWHSRPNPYIPPIVKHKNSKPDLVKEIKLLSKDGKDNDILIKRKMIWFGYNNEKYEGEYFIKKSEMNQATQFKNSLSEQMGYGNILAALEQNDRDKLGNLYDMFSKIKIEKNLNDKRFAEMMVSFVQQIPYYLVLQESCNPSIYKEDFIKEMLKQSSGRCSPNQKFGITSPAEFMGNLQGDCDSRTLLLHTILKHFQFDAIIVSSDIYHHSLLGVNLPYNGQNFNIMGSRYILWETTAPDFVPGNIPIQVSNMNNWNITLK